MAVKKIAISVPEEVIRQVDRLAKRTHTTRSGLISQILKEVSHAQTQADLTVQINRVFDDFSVREEQSSTSKTFLRAAESDGSSSGDPNGNEDQW
jgi:metal-responsive CopG/Arc/MetJ family transcriptional regulator